MNIIAKMLIICAGIIFPGCAYRLTNKTLTPPANINSIAIESPYNTSEQVLPMEIMWNQVQREFIKFPPILFLGNEISLSLGALKDIIQVGISQGFLVAVIIGGYLIQDLNNAKERGKTRISDYGKKVVKAGDDG